MGERKREGKRKGIFVLKNYDSSSAAKAENLLGAPAITSATTTATAKRKNGYSSRRRAPSPLERGENWTSAVRPSEAAWCEVSLPIRPMESLLP